MLIFIITILILFIPLFVLLFLIEFLIVYETYKDYKEYSFTYEVINNLRIKNIKKVYNNTKNKFKDLINDFNKEL